MKQFLLFFILLFLQLMAAQDTVVKHIIKKGETVRQIAQKYKVTAHDIFQRNPGSSEGIKEGATLLIPVREEGKILRTAVVDYEVQQKETLYSIAKQYHCTIEELLTLNPTLAEGLKAGQIIQIPNQQVTQTTAVKTSVVQEQLTKGDGRAEQITKITAVTYSNYTVKPGETLYGLTKSLAISEQALLDSNPELKEGLRSGMVLRVPTQHQGKEPAGAGHNKQADVSRQAISKSRKELVLLLPFNLQRIKRDTVNTITERFKKDAFLNMTLDFYAGALMAIDSARTLGLNLDVRIYDSAETKTSSPIEELCKSKNLHQADAIIGPFYQQHAERLAELLQENQVPVISPMSKEAGSGQSNLFLATPSEVVSKQAMFAYMQQQGGNIIVVNDVKRQANRQFIKENYSDIALVELNENGGFSPENCRSLLMKDKLNYIVLDSERTGMILAVTNFMLGESTKFRLQLVIIEPNETFDFADISMKRLATLNLLYPSTTRENKSKAYERFQRGYRQLNKVFPSQYAVRGFDVTFDTILRLVQEQSFSASAQSEVTEQVEGKFQYVKRGEQYVNEGVYILQLNDDFTLKQIN